MMATTSHFVFHFHSEDERSMKSLIDQSEVFRKEIIEDIGINFEEKTRVYLALSSSKYQEIQPGEGVPSWSAGVAYPGLT
jgi:hypothetical protein